MFGYYSVDVQKTFGETVPVLNNDKYLTTVGSVAAVFNAIRFIWSAFLDKYSYKKVYGVLLLIQICVALTMKFAIKSKFTYATWICIALFCEGGHFTLVPNILKKIYGEQATGLYGVAITFTGLTSLMMIPLLETALGKDYIIFYLLTACFSTVSLIILTFFFTE